MTPVSKPFSKLFSALVALSLVLGAALLRLGYMNSPPGGDEIYHILAAQSLLSDGTLRMGVDGEYVRASGFTHLVAFAYKVTGNVSPYTARLPAFLAGILVPAVLFLWLKTYVGLVPALFAALLYIFYPDAISQSQTSRFYSIHALLILLMAISAFAASQPRGWTSRLLLILLTLALGVPALHLQDSTLVFGMALVFWLALARGVPFIARSAHWRPLSLAVGALLVLATILVLQSGQLAALWENLRWADTHAMGTRDAFLFYLADLLDAYPAFLVLFPFLAAAAFLAHRDLAGLCLVLFAVSFVVLSLGGQKSPRYLTFAMPFLFVVVALGGSELVRILWAPLRNMMDRLVAQMGLLPETVNLGALLCGVGLAIFVLINPAFKRAITVGAGKSISAGGMVVDMTGLADLIAENTGGDPLIVSTTANHTIYHLGDLDLIFTLHRNPADREEFEFDPRIGRFRIFRIKSFKDIAACARHGIIVSNRQKWEIPGAAADVLQGLHEIGMHTRVIRDGDIVLVAWTADDETPPGTECDKIPSGLGRKREAPE